MSTTKPKNVIVYEKGELFVTGNIFMLAEIMLWCHDNEVEIQVSSDNLSHGLSPNHAVKFSVTKNRELFMMRWL